MPFLWFTVFLVRHLSKSKTPTNLSPASARMSCSLNLERLRTEPCLKHKATLNGQKERERRRVSFQSLQNTLIQIQSTKALDLATLRSFTSELRRAGLYSSAAAHSGEKLTPETVRWYCCRWGGSSRWL